MLVLPLLFPSNVGDVRAVCAVCALGRWFRTCRFVRSDGDSFLTVTDGDQKLVLSKIPAERATYSENLDAETLADAFGCVFAGKVMRRAAPEPSI
jgi:hypothetical protein